MGSFKVVTLRASNLMPLSHRYRTVGNCCKSQDAKRGISETFYKELVLSHTNQHPWSESSLVTMARLLPRGGHPGANSSALFLEVVVVVVV